MDISSVIWNNPSFSGFFFKSPFFSETFLNRTNDTCLFNTSSCSNGTGVSRPGIGVAGVLIPLIYIIVCIIGRGGNTLVIHMSCTTPRRNPSPTSTSSIGPSPTSCSCSAFPSGPVQNAMMSWPFGSFMCRLVMTVDGINQFTSIFCLTVMSIDRYLAVVHPIRSSRWRRPQVAKAVNGSVWAMSFIVVLPMVVFAGVFEKGGTCNINWPESCTICRAAFIIYTSTVGFFFPLLVICMCYLLIVVKIRSSSKKVHATSSKRRKSERKVTRMVVIVVAVFVFCWLPFYALNIINLIVFPPPSELQGFYYFVVVLSYANSCANPIVYSFPL
ncbi:hypothetical protein QTP70_009629 [Hemibagrus guttatus]|uniref:G-protein coupled receptors family 1 profile domain-containing protein n=1 Tax=Hemibagrus guttatus TaxID=175788 RepID=A0AAE0QG01_9TELE|nr:hypothetical protein QTP70_009629 [Hemibagrus guttatus]